MGTAWRYPTYLYLSTSVFTPYTLARQTLAVMGPLKIEQVVTVNGARVMLEGGAWALVRPSSNTPNLVVVCESTRSEDELRAIFEAIDAVIRQEPSVGDYDQTF